MKPVSPLSRNLSDAFEALATLSRTRWREVTLTADADATVVIDPTVNEMTGVQLIARTANAKIEEHASPYCLVTVSRGSFTIAHSNNSQTDRTFFWFAAGD